MVVLVVGAGRKGNIGYAIAKKFQDEGHTVVAVDVDFNHEEFHRHYCDVTSEKEVALQMDIIKGEFELDAIINSAGVNILALAL